MYFSFYRFKNGADIDKAISNGFYIDTRNVLNDNIYSYAAYKGERNLVKYFNDNKEKYPKLDFDVVDKYGNNVLCASAMGGHIDIFEYLLEHNKLDIHVKNKYGSSVYHLAAMNNHVHFLKHLEEKYNWDINERSNNGNTAYIWAAKYDILSVLKHFESKKDFDIYHVNNDGDCAYHLSKLRGVKHFESKKDFNIHVEGYHNGKAYHFAAYNNNRSIMRHFETKHGFDGKYLDGMGSSVYHWAVASGKLITVMNIEKNVKNINPYLKNKLGKTIYDVAVDKKFKKILDFFEAKNYLFNPDQDQVTNKIISKLKEKKDIIQRKKDLINKIKEDLRENENGLRENENDLQKFKDSLKAIIGKK